MVMARHTTSLLLCFPLLEAIQGAKLLPRLRSHTSKDSFLRAAFNIMSVSLCTRKDAVLKH